MYVSKDYLREKYLNLKQDIEDILKLINEENYDLINKKDIVRESEGIRNKFEKLMIDLRSSSNVFICDCCKKPSYFGEIKTIVQINESISSIKIYSVCISCYNQTSKKRITNLKEDQEIFVCECCGKLVDAKQAFLVLPQSFLKEDINRVFCCPFCYADYLRKLVDRKLF